MVRNLWFSGPTKKNGMRRREFPAKVKDAAFDRAKGACQQCTRPLSPGDIHYDHIIPDGSGGEPILTNCQVLCRSCHGTKTRGDVRTIAKGKRIKRNHIGARKRSKFRGWRRFDGTIVHTEEK